jgi:hypothetical protein
MAAARPLPLALLLESGERRTIGMKKARAERICEGARGPQVTVTHLDGYDGRRPRECHGPHDSGVW